MNITPATRQQIKYDFSAKFQSFNVSDIDNYLDGLIDDISCLLGNYDYNIECDKTAVLYLLAHELKLTVDNIQDGDGDSPRLALSTSVGSVSESYGDNTISKGLNTSYLWLTIYGQRFYRLTSKKRCGVMFV